MTTSSNESVELFKLLEDALNASRIPITETLIFNGDPLKYNNWKILFEIITGKKNIQDKENIYYLHRCVIRQAKKALGSYFYISTEYAYATAWEVLEKDLENPSQS